jgi:sialate O-acetylesterase
MKLLSNMDVRLKPDNKIWEDLDFNDKEYSAVNYDDKALPEITLPGEWENQGVGNFDGIVWLRKKIAIPESWINKNLVIELGPVDDMDRTYVNGTLAGAMENQGAWDDNRIYNIPASVNNSADMTIAVRVLDLQGGGGINGKKEQMKLTNPSTGESIPLDGLWKYYLAAEYFDKRFYSVDNHVKSVSPPAGNMLTAVSPSVLYNAMINPIINYMIKGAIWYQGESNAWNNDAALYQKQLPLMIEDWRSAWGIGNFPFYYVQIAPYEYTKGGYSQVIRDAQLKTLSFPNTGMAVTMDIGDLKTIHPSNKKDVGGRLALWALAKNYGKKMEYSGPLFKSFSIEGNKIVVSFDHASGMIIKPVNNRNNFEIAGADKIFKPANVIIKGNKLYISADGLDNPVAVRYAWSNTSFGTLFNKAGLPASSFRTDNWDYLK